MQKITHWIFKLSPKKLAVYLLVLPLVLITMQTVFSVTDRNLTEVTTNIASIWSIANIITLALFIIPILIWMLWLKGAVFSAGKKQLGLPLKWFQIALIVFIIHLIFVFLFSFLEWYPDGIRSIFSSLSEGVRIIGLIIAYPLICHFAGRAVYIKKKNQAATFANSIWHTLILIFIPISIPFLHRHFNGEDYDQNKLVTVYAVAGVICIFMYIAAFFAAITGVI